VSDDKNAEDLFGEAEINPLDKPYFPAVKYRPKRPKQKVFALCETVPKCGVSDLNDLLDKGWRVVQQLETTGATNAPYRSLYLLELEGE
jgi:hypothetical protein